MKHHPDLTSSEIANLWSSYMSDSMNICMMEHFIKTVGNQRIERLLKHSKELSEGHIKKVTVIFNKENFPIPQAYGTSDVNKDAPKLFSDTLYLRYLESMARSGMSIYGMALGTSYRKDIREFYSLMIKETEELYNDIVDLLEDVGTLVRTPYMPYPEKIEFIKDEHFMAGYLTLHQRPLLAIEINHLSNNIESNYIGKTIMTGFAQVAELKEVRHYFKKGMDLGVEIIKTLSKNIDKNHTDTPFSADSTVTSSIIAPFSEKLMMGLTASLNMISLGNLGQGLGASMRSDLVGEYTQIMARVGKYAHEGAKISIENRWLEKPPQTPDRNALQNNEKS